MKTGNTWSVAPIPEPAHVTPQWSPVMKTGNTNGYPSTSAPATSPQWSPVMKTGNTGDARTTADLHQASMEPGHEDREYLVMPDEQMRWFTRLNGARS